MVGELKFWQRLLAIGLALFWLVMIPTLLITGERALGDCLSDLFSLNLSGCLSSMAAAGASYIIFKWGSLILLGAFILVTVFRLIGSRQESDRTHGSSLARSDQPPPPDVTGPF